MKRILITPLAILILLAVNFSIYQKEQLLTQGRSFFLELAPVDPRSLMQGDYMILRYLIANEVTSVQRDGYLVVEPDENKVVHFKRIHDEKIPLTENQQLLRFRKRGSALRLGAESFFFQEGYAGLYENAHYGELKIADSGESILVGLRDETFNLLGSKIISQ